MDVTYVYYSILAISIWIIIKILVEKLHKKPEDEPDIPCEGHLWGKNLLKNNCGQNKLLYWDKVVNAGNGWVVQETPNGADPLPKTANGMKILDFGKNTCCFATPGEMCMKEQVVDLMGQGFTEEDLDKQPIIKISEWFASHADFIGDYLLEATLLNEKKENMKSFLFKDDFSDKQLGKWHQVTHIFSNYGIGVRYVKFTHAGQSQLNFPGHLGTKISGGVVSLQPLIKKRNEFKYQ